MHEESLPSLEWKLLNFFFGRNFQTFPLPETASVTDCFEGAERGGDPCHNEQNSKQRTPGCGAGEGGPSRALWVAWEFGSEEVWVVRFWESAEDALAGWLVSRSAPCLIMYQEARKGVGLSFQFRGRKKRCGVSRLRNEQADLFRASERKNQMYSSRVTVTEGLHCTLT